jgi:hypothetical protein
MRPAPAGGLDRNAATRNTASSTWRRYLGRGRGNHSLGCGMPTVIDF